MKIQLIEKEKQRQINIIRFNLTDNQGNPNWKERGFFYTINEYKVLKIANMVYQTRCREMYHTAQVNRRIFFEAIYLMTQLPCHSLLNIA